MRRDDGMKWVDAEYVEAEQILLVDDRVVKVVQIEWPYAVVRVYEDGSFGRREMTKLEGTFFVPSPDFLREAGIYQQTLTITGAEGRCVFEGDSVEYREEEALEWTTNADDELFVIEGLDRSVGLSFARAAS